MIKKVLLIISIMFTFSACADENYTGTYVESEYGMILFIKEDHTAILTTKDRSYSDNKVWFTNKDGSITISGKHATSKFFKTDKNKYKMNDGIYKKLK